MQSLLEKNLNSKGCKDDLKVFIQKFFTFGEKSVMVLVSHIWNMLPAELKREISYREFKTQINNWFGLRCNCSACKYIAD